MAKEEIYLLCKQHIHRYVRVQMEDGSVHDGMVENVDDDRLYLAVPVGGMEMEPSRAFLPYSGFGYGYPYEDPYSYPGYGYGDGTGYGYGYGYPGGGLSGVILPLAALTALSLLPYY
jgi:hypothetical protein